ncbi:DUF3145 domain-containing protein [Rhodococcus sp. ARC_M6]|uniref:DUF3145 domain-containing protein n=1 Tax=Rhodococcus sp. ARC_M6 TaxID=2928852 RepID=UPI001FB4501F|nr:DUF3145 domain-containing protein [Rhodococcus sp. ARC_M6]MCJ0903370.1 DUF3145 domain-containing protein [Rhodococcus sp. ARC_M6]
MQPNHLADLTAGVVYIHSSPAALCPHVDWALSATLASPAKLRWTSQPADNGLLRATTDWSGPVGTGARLVDSLRVWPMLRFEVTEDASSGVDGERYSHVPGLGLWRGSTSANGDVMVGEMRLRSIMKAGGDIVAEIDRAMGAPWDEELEPYRSSGEGAEVMWLHRRVS